MSIFIVLREGEHTLPFVRLLWGFDVVSEVEPHTCSVILSIFQKEWFDRSKIYCLTGQKCKS